ncbi:unnamed protein product [Durusdinium trenchii]|uniref:Far11/STRP C-terminal domain-containing protein n=1 Tax=Durusdinium trenchii TaxID=1381693 RepID=A0ABP0LI40_9DINO
MVNECEGPEPERARTEEHVPLAWSPGIEKPLQEIEVLLLLDEFLYRGEVHDLTIAHQSFDRIAASLGAEDLDAIVPPCLEVLEFANRYIRNDTLLCLLHVSMGCMTPDAPLEERGLAMRRHAALLAKHEAMPMLVRALDHLLGLGTEERDQEDGGMYERELRLILNCILLQLLFNEHDPEFAQSLDKGCGRMGASLPSLLLDAAMTCLVTEKVLPIKKIVLLLLRVLQRMLSIPDKVLYPVSERRQGETLACQRPRVMDFQAFTSLHLHRRQIRSKYGGSGYPAAVEEGLKLAAQYEDEFLAAYAFHPSELDFMKDSPALRDAYLRYEELRAMPGSRGCGRLLPRAARKARQNLPRPGELLPAVCPESLESHHAGGLDMPSASSRESSLSDSVRSQLSVASAVTEVPLEFDVARGDLKATPVARGGDKLDSDESSAAIWHRLYASMLPRLTELVVLLLRLLLTSCSNVDTYSGIVDFARERKAAEHAQAHEFNEAEAQRHREILAAAVAGVILILLKSARRFSSEDFAFLSQLLAESNGALVVLKYLNQNPDVCSGQDTSGEPLPPVLPCLQAASAAGRRLPLSSCFWQACGTLRLVEVLYLVCRDCPERVRKYLIHYRAPFILKRLNRVESPHAQRLVLKLLKKQVRYLPRKWKQANMKAISAMYLQVTMSPLEDWLLNENLAEQSMEGPSAKALESLVVISESRSLRPAWPVR